jgi:hypothetical protein
MLPAAPTYCRPHVFTSSHPLYKLPLPTLPNAPKVCLLRLLTFLTSCRSRLTRGLLTSSLSGPLFTLPCETPIGSLCTSGLALAHTVHYHVCKYSIWASPHTPRPRADRQVSRGGYQAPCSRALPRPCRTATAREKCSHVRRHLHARCCTLFAAQKLFAGEGLLRQSFAPTGAVRAHAQRPPSNLAKPEINAPGEENFVQRAGRPCPRPRIPTSYATERTADSKSANLLDCWSAPQVLPDERFDSRQRPPAHMLHMGRFANLPERTGACGGVEAQYAKSAHNLAKADSLPGNLAHAQS